MATAVQMTSGTPTAPPPAGHNSGIDPAVQVWLDQCTAYGDQAGAGDTSLIAWFKDMVDRAWRGEITPDVAPLGTQSYQDARRKRAAVLGKRVTGGDGKADKVRESEARKMIKIGALPTIHGTNHGGMDVFERALRIIGNDVRLKGETSKMILKVMTAQLKHSDTPLSDDDIRTILRPKDTSDKGEGEYLTQATKCIELAVKSDGMDNEKKAALAAIARRLAAIGYQTAQQQLAEAKAAAKLKADKAKAARTKKK